MLTVKDRRISVTKTLERFSVSKTADDSCSPNIYAKKLEVLERRWNVKKCYVVNRIKPK